MAGCGRSRTLAITLALVLYPACALMAGGKPRPRKATQAGSQPPRRAAKLDPAAWGADHVGKPAPELTTGDECLFCHRRDVGPTWPRNAHNRTVRAVEADPEAVAPLQQSPELRGVAGAVTHVLGGERRTRFLKRGAAYGHFDLLTTQWRPERGPTPGALLSDREPRWDERHFGDRCAGCHTTGVDPTTGAFGAMAVDCVACHGEVEPAHATDAKRALLSSPSSEPARVVVSTCASCHVRSGKSRSTGKPFPSNFVAGDNVFRDFAVSFDAKALAALNPIDRHVLENVRDVAVLNRTDATCLSCHDIHARSTVRHRSLKRQSRCDTCHTPGSATLRKYEVHSSVCEY